MYLPKHISQNVEPNFLVQKSAIRNNNQKLSQILLFLEML